MKFNTFSSTPGRVMVHIGLVLVQWFKRSPCGPVLKLPLLPDFKIKIFVKTPTSTLKLSYTILDYLRQLT